MKATKHFILALATMLLLPKAVWGQEPEPTTTDINTCTITVSPNVLTYTGTEQTVDVTVTSGSATLTPNTDYEVSGNKGTNAGSYTITVTGKGNYSGEANNVGFTILARNISEVTATEVKKMTWTGNVITPSINGQQTNDNNITLAYNSYQLNGADFTYTSVPTTIKEVGGYILTFEGRGNFTGTKLLVVHVVKDIATITGLETDKLILRDGTTWTKGGDWTTLPLVLKDGSTTLTNATDYSISVYQTQDDATNNTNELTAIAADGIYYVKSTGKGTYGNSNVYKVYVLDEYTRNNDNTFDLRLTSASREGVFAMIENATGTAVIDASTTVLTVTEPKVKCGDENITLTLTGIGTGAFKNCTGLTGVNLLAITTITEIADGAFEGCTALRYIDLANAKDFTPSSLQRNIAASPFYGVPKQALVYLNGTTFTGENYVYRPGDGTDYFCELCKIYDDMSGNQLGFSETDGYKWAFENRHNFTAYTLENTRMLTAGRHYTVCLPYSLDIPNTFKAYTLDAASSNLFGFREVTGKLALGTNSYPVPYVIIPSASGQLLSATNVLVQECKEEDMTAKLEENKVAVGGYAMYPNMRYSAGSGEYIMQYNNGNPTWKSIGTTTGYDGACILPMRAYIEELTGNGSREKIGVRFTNQDGTTMIYDQESLLPNDCPEARFDLQGRRVDGIIKPGVYIQNGKKLVLTGK